MTKAKTKRPAKKKLPILVQNDGWLEPYSEEVQRRIDSFKAELNNYKNVAGGLKKFAQGHKFLGFNYDKSKKGWWYREWAPKATKLYLTGDFNGWDRNANPLKKKAGGVWEIFLPDSKYRLKLTHDSSLKVHVVAANGATDRIPAYIERAVQLEGQIDFVGKFWNPAKAFKWTDKDYSPKKSFDMPLIYECHIGMATEEESIGTYREFADNILPRIKALGYNSIQSMAIQEHPYYGSFGYHVSNFFAVSSRFGTPDDFKYLVNKAHEMGIAVIMDLVHSHAVKNISEGLNQFDGSDDQYFHEGGRGYHNAWDSKLFNYGKWEVRQFLLSNIRYWIEEYHVDGFRFDGVTSMLYMHHGDVSFDNYDKYFKSMVDWDTITYLQLANELAHSIKPYFITIAEDMSGMPGLCRPQKEGGIGFDFRLAMGLPDYWIKILKERRDEDWNVHELWGTMNNRRYGERTIAYAESHDQAIVGDKTIAFWLMDKEMYTHMHKDHESMVVDRGMAFHKMIRCITMSCGGEGYLNFIGNEFGHPEWIDFPREGNNWSYKYARRQWSLVDNQDLRYQFLNNFDQAMVQLAAKYELLDAPFAEALNHDQDNLTLIYERKNLIFIFNFHWANSIPDYRFRVPHAGTYKIILNSDEKQFCGFDRIDASLEYPTVKLLGEHFLSVYLPNRICLVMERV
ncbi:MAG: alpha-amylase family glycosyl hydrolase [Cyclobacteriaceae bacterium]